MGFLRGFPENLAHNIGIKLEDGDIYEIRIHHDYHHEVYDSNYDFKKVKKYFFKDVLGKKYYIKGSKKGVRKLFEYRENNQD